MLKGQRKRIREQAIQRHWQTDIAKPGQSRKLLECGFREWTREAFLRRNPRAFQSDPEITVFRLALKQQVVIRSGFHLFPLGPIGTLPGVKVLCSRLLAVPIRNVKQRRVFKVGGSRVLWLLNTVGGTLQLRSQRYGKIPVACL